MSFWLGIITIIGIRYFMVRPNILAIIGAVIGYDWSYLPNRILYIDGANNNGPGFHPIWVYHAIGEDCHHPFSRPMLRQ